MRNNPILAIFIFSTVLLIIDIYVYSGIKRLSAKLSARTKKIIRISHWLTPVIVITGLLTIIYFRYSVEASNQIRVFHFFSGFFLLIYIPKLVFVLFKLLEDFIRMSSKFAARRVVKKGAVNDKLNKMSRAEFLTKAGIITAGIPFASIIYGISKGRFDFTVRKVPIVFPNLPSSFNKIKIVHISDFHCGSFINHVNEVERAVDIINSLNPDVIVFTGDLVNNLASELDPFVKTLSQLRAKYGKYSILGNHDYGDYVRWDSQSAKQDNFNRLIEMQNKAGFRLLLNESERLEVGGSYISLIGVENWGLPPFPQYGNLQKAWNFVEAHIKVAVENYNKTVEHLQNLIEKKRK